MGKKAIVIIDGQAKEVDMDATNIGCLGCLLVILAVTGLGVWYFAQHKFKGEIATLKGELETWKKGVLPSSDSFMAFWPNKVHETDESLGGFLISDKFIPLRAIARDPTACLYNSSASAGKLDANNVVDHVAPWFPYYIFALSSNTIQVAQKPTVKKEERAWVHVGYSFCWITRECLNLETETPLYRTLEDAKAGKNAAFSAYTYRYAEHFQAQKASKSRFVIPALPVLERKEKDYWCVVGPDSGTGRYDSYWLKFDSASPYSVRLRIRTTRRELETYLAGVQRLLREYKNPETKDKAHLGLYNQAIGYVTKTDDLTGTGDRNILRERMEGIPNLTGFLERPIESDIQYAEVSKKALKLLELSNDPTAWDAYDVAYPLLEELP
jgi:hypothetical protein